jgi:ribosomal protein S18 acetylase RimI-like enzyme
MARVGGVPSLFVDRNVNGWTVYPIACDFRQIRWTMIEIREANDGDWRAIWPIFHAVVASGDTHVNSPDTTEQRAHDYWIDGSQAVYVALDGGVVVGTYRLRPNQPDLGSHVANAGFMVAVGQEGRGIGRAMAEHALREAKRMGYGAMQFNFVINTNVRAVGLWRSLGFIVVGTLPSAFQHARLGLVDALVMYRAL